MDPKSLAALALLASIVTPLVVATSYCPANAPNIGPYNRVTILNDQRQEAGYKLVNKTFYVKGVRVNTDKTESPLNGYSVNIYFCKTAECMGSNKQHLISGTLDRNGEYPYKPMLLGKYKIECANKGIFLETKMLLNQPSQFGAVCGDGKCEADKLETVTNCPEDCAVCGDAKCEGLENKENCPDDCVICGDDVCDDLEVGAAEIYCAADCLKCGDGMCRAEYGEVCPEDCISQREEPEKDIVTSYWWVGAIIGGGAAALIIFLTWRNRRRIAEEEEEGYGTKPGKSYNRVWETPFPKKKKSVEDDEDVKDIVKELMDSGVSEKRIAEKMEDFGLDEDEAAKVIKKAKKER